MNFRLTLVNTYMLIKEGCTSAKTLRFCKPKVQFNLMQMLTNNEQYLGRISGHYMLIKIAFSWAYNFIMLFWIGYGWVAFRLLTTLCQSQRYYFIFVRCASNDYCSRIQTHNHIVYKQTLKHIANLNDWGMLWELICMVHLTVCS